jgi:hypothetical protein
MPGVDGQLGLADPGHALDRRDHDRVASDAAAQYLAELVEFCGAAGEVGQVGGQRVLRPDLQGRLCLAEDDAECLPPLRRIAGVWM